MTAPIRIGVAGLGRAFMIMLPTLRAHPRVTLVAACDPREEARHRFVDEFGGRAYASVESLCGDPEVNAVYVATPHQHHAAHVMACAKAHKHVLVEKPLAVTLAECDAMIEAARTAGVALVVGHSHSFDAPYRRAREIIDSGEYGSVRMIHALNYTDFLYRPRRPEELDTVRGGGAVFNQGAHQVNVVRLLAGSPVRSVRAQIGAWDPARPTEGAYSAQLTFANGAFASLTYSGYAHFDSDELMGGIGELGERKQRAYGAARAALGASADEVAQRYRRTYGQAAEAGAATVAHNHFGMVIVSCEHADLRPMPDGVMVYADDRAYLDPLPAPRIPRAEVLDEWCDAIDRSRPALHTGEWGRATLAVCIAILDSGRNGGRELRLSGN